MSLPTPIADESSAQVCWVTGAGGLIGHALVSSSHLPAGWRAQGLTRDRLDLMDFAAVERAFKDQPPQAIVHCAALSKSPACQAHPALARRINIEVTRHLAALARDIPFLFFSTDLVFDGRRGQYFEDDPVNPLNVYGETKAEAERIVGSNPHHTVVRTSLNHGTSPTGDRAFNEETLGAWRAGRVTRLFVDEFRCPIPATVTARATWELLERRITGLLHLAGGERLSRFEIGAHLATRHPEVTARMEPAFLHEYRGAPRAPDTSLNTSRVAGILSFPLPRYREAV